MPLHPEKFAADQNYTRLRGKRGPLVRILGNNVARSYAPEEKQSDTHDYHTLGPPISNLFSTMELKSRTRYPSPLGPLNLYRCFKIKL